jgi:ABC-2 type transport system ATP-binding protein
MTVAIEANGLTKDFEKGRRTLWQRVRREPDRRETFRAVDGVDLRVEEGEVFGILGPNGAGKTTTMRMLATLLEPTSGTATVLGHDLVRDARAIRRRLGAVLSGERSLYWKLTARENLEYFAALYHVPPREAGARIAAILEVVHLTDRADDYVEKFSTGMRQRLVLARALLPAPALLLLDEPTVGLDPQAARDLRDRVLMLRDEGRTVLLTTHYMEEADQLCDRIAIVDHGRIVALDTPAGLKRGLNATEVVRLEVTAPAASDGALVARVGRAGEVTHSERENGSLHLTVHCTSARDLVPLVIDAARDEAAEVRNIQVLPVSLEDVFIALTGRALRE